MREELTTSQLSTYEVWMQEAGLTLWDYLKIRCDLEVAAVFTTLLFPEVIEEHGCILLKEQAAKADVKAWLEKCDGDVRRVESVINEVHVYDLFEPGDRTADASELYRVVGRALVKGWRVALARQYPDRKFELSYEDEPQAYGPTVSFCSSDT